MTKATVRDCSNLQLRRMLLNKQAASVKGLLQGTDRLVRAFGRLFGAGKSYAEQAAGVKRMAKGTGAFQDPYIRPGIKHYIEDIAKLNAKKRVAERVVGYTATGVPILATGTTVYALSGDGEAGDAGVSTATPADAHTAADQVASPEAVDNAATDSNSEKSTLLRNLGLYGGSALVGGTVGGLLDRRNRLRGILLGATITPAVTAAADYLYQSSKNKA